MKYNNNLEIELDWEAVQCYSKMRYYYYRIKPNQLSLWNRLFHNSWKRLEKAFDDHWNPLFNPEDYWKYLYNMKTFGDVKIFKESEWNKIQQYRKNLIDNKKVFPYEDEL